MRLCLVGRPSEGKADEEDESHEEGVKSGAGLTTPHTRRGLTGERGQTLKVAPRFRREIAIFGSRADPNVARKVIALMSSGQLKISDLITHTFPLTEFRHALDTFVNRRDGAIKVVIEPNAKEEK